MTKPSHHYARSSNPDAMRSLVPLATADARLCFACRKPITRVGDGYVMICDGPTLGYPYTWTTLRVALSHDACFPDRGGERINAPYSISFESLLSDGVDGPAGWVDHLRTKEWWAPTFEHDLRDAHALAQRIARRGARAKTGGERATISPRTRARVFERDGFRCRRCGRGPSDGVTLHCDHVVARSRGGSGGDTNLQTLCSDCNLGKADRPPHAHDLRPTDASYG